MRGAIARWSTRSRAAEAEKAPGQSGLAEAVARYLFKLMAYKDEYEVARLYSDTGFVERIKAQFDGDICASNSTWRRRSWPRPIRRPASRRRCRSGRGC